MYATMKFSFSYSTGLFLYMETSYWMISVVSVKSTLGLFAESKTLRVTLIKKLLKELKPLRAL
jgi:hypothetical protein